MATVKVLRTIPKEPDGFTQGLEVRNGVLYESVGLVGKSEMRTVDLKTGKVLKRVSLDPKLFAEGASIAPNGNLVQLTWTDRVAIVRDLTTLKEKGRFFYEQEGWGLCYSDRRKAFVHSDGSSSLFLRDTKTFKQLNALTISVPNGGAPNEINELECDGRSVLANVWMQNVILDISVDTGVVSRIIDASAIVPSGNRSPDDVLNGIAKLGKGRYLLTGKRWAWYYEVTFVDSSPNNPS